MACNRRLPPSPLGRNSSLPQPHHREENRHKREENAGTTSGCANAKDFETDCDNIGVHLLAEVATGISLGVEEKEEHEKYTFLPPTQRQHSTMACNRRLPPSPLGRNSSLPQPHHREENRHKREEKPSEVKIENPEKARGTDGGVNKRKTIQPLPTVPETPDIEERHLKRGVTETDDEPKFNFPAVNVDKEEKTLNVLDEMKKPAEVIKVKVNPRKRKAV
ncbi:hypothetical protein LR48_Vigan04g166600 [Vigna angularis]|uniref:Uncharacterized protein n=1 Tax=Phaseolus angularis TaxID=3914 RepID=A0A0L9UFH3_PHAAN|nr:hypothetical protein LR48_Vigan04g166600 [Vigna angularis]